LGHDNLNTGRSLASLGLLFYYQGKVQEALPLMVDALEVMGEHLDTSHQEIVDLNYNLACLHALHQNREKSLTHLRQAVDGGFANPYITEDGDLSLLHGDPEYERLVQEVIRRAGP
jgi:hypothetical protein